MEDEEEEENRKKALDELLAELRSNRMEILWPSPLHGEEMLAVLEALEGNTSVKSAHFFFSLGAEGASVLGKALRREECALERLELGYNTSSEVTGSICTALEQNTSVTRLEWYQHHFGEDGVEAVARLLGRNGRLKWLGLRGHALGQGRARPLVDALEMNACIRVLDLGENALGDDGAIAVACVMEKNVHLRCLSLRTNNITSTGAMAIFKALEKSAVSSLDMSKNPLGEAPDGKALWKILGTVTNLTWLNLASCALSARVGRGIAKPLAKNRSLLKVDLGNNSLDDSGVEAIARALQHNESVTSLCLNSNGFHTPGAKALAVLLEKNVTLASLELCGNSVADNGARALAASLAKNSTLTLLDLGMCQIGPDGARGLASLLTTTSTLVTLRLAFNDLRVGSQAVAAALERNSSLTHVEMNGYADSDDSPAIAKALEVNRSLARVKVGDRVERQGIDSVLAALEKNPCWTQMDLISGEARMDQEERYYALEARNRERRDCFVRLLLDGSLNEARQMLKEGIDLHLEAEGKNILVALLRAGRLDSFHLLLQTRFARSLLLDECKSENHIQPVAPVLDVLQHEMWRFPRHKGVVARLGELFGRNVSLARLLGRIKCAHAARALYAVLRKRFKVPWSCGAEPKPIPRDMARMLNHYVWQSRLHERWSRK